LLREILVTNYLVATVCSTVCNSPNKKGKFSFATPCFVVITAPMPAHDHVETLRSGRICSIDECKHSSWEGGSIWPPALSLARYLDSSEQQVAGKTVLELGAGCGLVGLVAAHLGAEHVTLTDRACAMAILEHNVAVNSMGERVTVRELEWEGGASDVETFSLIIASECLYDEDSVLPLLRTMHALSTASTIVLLSGIIGHSVQRAFERNISSFFSDYSIVPADDGGDDPPPSRAIHRITGRRDGIT
jgi:predicted nicotinamide N-methyase